MKSPDTIVYEQDSQMALSCFQYDSLFCKCFPMQKSQILVTLKMLKKALYNICTAFENYSKVTHYWI